METDLVYFTRRALEERLAASKASQELAKQSHLDLAERFEELAAAIRKRDLELSPHLANASSEEPVSA